MNKRLASALIGVAFVSAMFAQSGTNSPYSQYGLGLMSDQTSGFNRGMNGLGLGFRESNQVNFINPASYSSIDSLSFIFDVGLSGQITNFKENGVRKNARNGNFEYAVAAFRAFRHVGVSFGLVPFTNVGYDYSHSDYVDNSMTTKYTNSYSGTGGLHQAYVGIGAQPFKGFSVGVNVSYLWGDITRTITNAYSDAYINSMTKSYEANVRNYKLDFGAQYSLNVTKKDVLTIGATYGLGHKLNADAKCDITLQNTQSSVSTTTSMVAENALELPTMIGAGFSVNHNNRLKIGADYQLQKWGDVGFPVYQVHNNVAQYVVTDNYFSDRHKVTIGGEWSRNPLSRRWLDRVKVRLGCSYATSYLKINGNDGPKEMSVSAGFGIPFSNAINSYMVRPILNISGQWVRQSADGLLRENTFRLNIGLTFNERWFAKWKVD